MTTIVTWLSEDAAEKSPFGSIVITDVKFERTTQFETVFEARKARAAKLRIQVTDVMGRRID